MFMPVGLTREGNNAFHVIPRNGMNESTPLLTVGGFEKPVISIRCNPQLFSLSSASDTPSIDLDGYRMVVAVMTMDSVYIFDTERATALWSVSGLHYGALTDIAWSADGLRLLVTSTDGFCSTIQFEVGDLGSGEVLPAEVQESLRSRNKNLAAAARPVPVKEAQNVGASLMPMELDSGQPSSEPDPNIIPVKQQTTIDKLLVNQLVPKKRVMTELVDMEE